MDSRVLCHAVGVVCSGLLTGPVSSKYAYVYGYSTIIQPVPQLSPHERLPTALNNAQVRLYPQVRWLSAFITYLYSSTRAHADSPYTMKYGS